MALARLFRQIEWRLLDTRIFCDWTATFALLLPRLLASLRTSGNGGDSDSRYAQLEVLQIIDDCLRGKTQRSPLKGLTAGLPG